MAFVVLSPLQSFSRPAKSRRHVCVRPRAQASTPPPPRKGSLPSEEPTRKKLTRNLPVEGNPVEPPPRNGSLSSEEPTRKKLTRNLPVEGSPLEFAVPAAGEAGGPEVGEGLGPRTPTEEKITSKAAAAQGYMGFADAWASQNRDRGGSRFDVWFWIGLSFILTPPCIIVWAVGTGVIPGFVNPY